MSVSDRFSGLEEPVRCALCLCGGSNLSREKGRTCGCRFIRLSRLFLGLLQLVDELFEEMDTDKDGRISLKEYKDGAFKNIDILQGLKIFSTTQ